MDILKKFKRNDDLIVHGTKMILGEGTYINIARMHDSNPQFKKVTEQLSRQRQSAIDAANERDKNKIFGEIAEEGFAQVCVTGWSGIEMDGVVVECNSLNIARVKTEVPELWSEMMSFAMNKANYVGSFDEDASVKN